MTVALQVHTIHNLNGIHMRVAGQLASYANKYSGTIELHDKENKRYANAKNPLDVLLLQIKFGQQIHINVSGSDVIKTITEVKTLL